MGIPLHVLVCTRKLGASREDGLFHWPYSWESPALELRA